MTNRGIACNIVKLFSQRGCRWLMRNADQPCPDHHPLRVSTTRHTSTMRAASALSWTSKAVARTRSFGRGSRSPSIFPPRGAGGGEANTGDGAGILIQIPDKFLRRECGRLGIPLPPAKDYGCGFVFLPRDAEQRDIVRALLHSIVEEEGQHLLGWREGPTDDHLIGASALSVEPHIMQVFIGRGPAVRDHAQFERKLYVIRKLFEKAVVAL